MTKKKTVVLLTYGKYFRITDIDDRNFGVEKLVPDKNGVEHWVNIAFVGGLKALDTVLKRNVGDWAAGNARRLAEADYDLHGISDDIAKLEKK